MSRQTSQGISRKGLDDAFEQEEIKKSNLLLEALLLRAQQKDGDEVAARFAQAAKHEEHLGQLCEQQGLREKSFVHRFSAAGCWAQAGNLHQAITLHDELLEQADLPARLRKRIQQHLLTLRARRARLYEEAAMAS